MQKTLSLAMIIACIFASVKTQAFDGKETDNFDPKEDLYDLKQEAANGQHKSWCKINAEVAKIFCKTKAMATTNKNQRNINSINCDRVYKQKWQACPSDRKLDQEMMKMAQKHKFMCTFNADVAQKYCRGKAYLTFDAIQRKNSFNLCTNNYDAAVAACHQRKLNKLLEEGAQKHKSLCTFEAFGSKHWCKIKALSFNANKRKSGFQACDNRYNLSVAQCAHNRLLIGMEKAIMAGNAHDSWCQFKNRTKWLWCKAAKSIHTNKDKRTANLAKCDKDYKGGDDLCNNQTTKVTVSASRN